MIRSIVWVAFLCAILAFGNPKKGDFVTWFTNQAIQQGNRYFGALGAGVSALTAGPIINSGTSRQDYFLFSTFTVGDVANTIITGEASQAKTVYVGFFYMMYLKLPSGLSQTVINFETPRETKKPTEPKTSTNKVSDDQRENLNALIKQKRPTCNNRPSGKSGPIPDIDVYVDGNKGTLVQVARGARSTDILVYDLTNNYYTSVNNTYPSNNERRHMLWEDADDLIFMLKNHKSCNFKGDLSVDGVFDCKPQSSTLSCKWTN